MYYILFKKPRSDKKCLKLVMKIDNVSNVLAVKQRFMNSLSKLEIF